MKRFAHLTALLAVFALATSTAAMGARHPDDQVTHGPGAVALEYTDVVARPDDRSILGAGGVTLAPPAAATRPDDRATHGQGAIGAALIPVIAPTVSSKERLDGFDWLDAGIGAAAALGLGLIVAGGAALAFRRGHAPAYS